MVLKVTEFRSHPRCKVNWGVEYRAVTPSEESVHESSKLANISETGACFLTMLEVSVGMVVDLRITPPRSVASPLTIKGVVVRVDDRFDVGQMFRAVGVRWVPGPSQVLLQSLLSEES